MWVKTTAGKYLLRPCFLGDAWFLRMDEDSLFLYVRSRARTAKAVLALMRRRLRVANISGKVDVDSLYKSTAAFPPDFRGIVSCWVGEVELSTAMPASVLCTNEGSVATRPNGKIHGL